MGIRARVRRAGCALALSAALALLSASAVNAQETDKADSAAAATLPTATAVLPVATTDGYESLGTGLRTWITERLGVAGIEVIPVAQLDAGLKTIGRPVDDGGDAPLLAKVGAGTALLVAIWVDGPEVELRMHSHSVADGQLLVGARERGPLADLPKLAVRALTEGLGYDAAAISGATPRLSDLAALGRARVRLTAGDLPGAWRELVPASGPTAEKLRTEIDNAPAPPAARSRLANVSNRTDQNWLRVRDALRDPRDPEIVLAGADAAMARGEPDRALRFFEKAAELAPTNVDAQFGRADALFDLGRGPDAAAAFLAAAKLAPGDPRAFRGLARIETLAAPERAKHSLRAGELQTARFEVEAARESLAEAGRLDAALAAVVATRTAYLDERLGHVDDAVAGYREARELGATDVETLLGLGRASAANGDGEAAADAFREVLKEQPELEPALAGLGGALAALGQDEAALEPLERAITRSPRDFAARRALGQVLARRGDSARALATLEHEGGAAWEHGALLREAAALRSASGDLAGAERTLDEAVSVAPDDPDTRAARASIYEAAGKTDLANAERETALLLGAKEIPKHAAAPIVAKTPEPAPAPEPSPAATKTPEPKPVVRAAAAASFAALAASYPTANPGSGRPLGRVVLLKTQEAIFGVGQIRRWLHPKKPNLASVDLALLEAVADRFPIEEIPEQGEADPAVAALLAGSDARDLIAAANQSLGADAVFVARLGNAGGAMFWSAEQPVLEVRLLGGTTEPGAFVVAQKLPLEPAAAFMQWNFLALGPWLGVVGLFGFAATRRNSGAPRKSAHADRAPPPAPQPREAPAPVQAAAPRRESAPAAAPRARASEPARAQAAAPAVEEEGPTAIAVRFRDSGQFAAAAAAFEAVFDYESAIDCYRRAGDTARALELLEKTGQDFEAGKLALERGETDRAIRNLQNVDLRDPEYDETCRLLADLVGEGEDLSLDDEEKRSPDETTDPADLDATDPAPQGASDAGDTSPFGDAESDMSLERTEQESGESMSFDDGDSGMALERSDQTLNTPAPLPPHLDPNIPTPSPGESSDAIAGIRLERVERAPDPPPAESRYELLNEIGRGGMGVVYQARDRRLGRTIALKKLPEELSNNPTAVKLFLREARAAAALNHPNIVTLFDADQEAGGYYITMEYLDGLPLDQILQKRGRVSPGDAIRLGSQIAIGLQYAHEQGVIHRDVKTSNLFFTRDRLVKIMDFGLAKMAQEVRRGAVIGGTPYYMAPEQATGDDADHRADLYAFGVTLFELLTGTLPFKDGDITWHHQNTAPPDPRSIAADLPDTFAELVLQLLEKDPAARPASAAEVGERLGEIATTLDAG